MSLCKLSNLTKIDQYRENYKLELLQFLQILFSSYRSFTKVLFVYFLLLTIT